MPEGERNHRDVAVSEGMKGTSNARMNSGPNSQSGSVLQAGEVSRPGFLM